MFGLESAMDELAVASGLDPVELRIRNEPEADPESGLPWSGRHLVECLRPGRGPVRLVAARAARLAEARATGWSASGWPPRRTRPT